MTDEQRPADPMQHCDYCGAEIGRFKHSRRLDGPLTCGDSACERDARDDERAIADEARMRAEDDDYDRYRGW